MSWQIGKIKATQYPAWFVVFSVLQMTILTTISMLMAKNLSVSFNIYTVKNTVHTVMVAAMVVLTFMQGV